MIHLHLHSHFSILDGLSKPKEIVNRAIELGQKAIAITDHASISSLYEFYHYAKEKGIQPIIGCEFYMVDNVDFSDTVAENSDKIKQLTKKINQKTTDKNDKAIMQNLREQLKNENKKEYRYHFLVIAKNWNGVKSIMKQLTKANKYFYKKPRLDWTHALQFEDCIVSTACSSGVLAHPDYESLVCGLHKQYGDDFYLEIMPHVITNLEEQESGGVKAIDYQEVVNKRAIYLSKKYNIPLVATQDAHYVRQEDAYTHEILLAIQTNKKMKDKDRWTFGDDKLYICDEQTFFKAFQDLGYLNEIDIKKAIANTEAIADKVELVMPKFTADLPKPYEKYEDEEMFWYILTNGAKKHYKEIQSDPETYKARLLKEVDIIKRLGFIRYFLIVHDIVTWAKNNGIEVGPARGSAAGSLVCYLMGITAVNPIEHRLLFERFLNPDRVDLPDIDLDFQDNLRHKVFEYIINKYGSENTANINTYVYIKPASAFRDVCRVFDINMMTVNYLSKKIHSIEDLEEEPEVYAFLKKHPEIHTQTLKLIGTIRQQGVHAAGVVVSACPINEVAVLEKRQDIYVCNWDKKLAEKFGLLKIDILGLSTLTVISHCKKLIKERYDVNIQLEDISLSDQKVIDNFAQGYGVGIFQFESRSAQEICKRIQVASFKEITDVSALNRPGSLQSGQTENYIKIHTGYKNQDHTITSLNDILSDTHGQIVYQEQLMRIFTDLANFTLAEADIMRKIVAKKEGDEAFEKHRKQFIQGCLENDIDEAFAENLFNDLVKFADYLFNLSHAVSYTILSFYCMYLKTYYPLEFMAALLTHNGKEDKLYQYIQELHRLGYKIKIPDINKSTNEYIIDDDNESIIAPLTIIKNIGERAVDEILKARDSKPAGVFLSVTDFENSVYRRVVNKRVMQNLKNAGAFECFGIINRDKIEDNKYKSELLPIYHNTIDINIRPIKLNHSLFTMISNAMEKYGSDILYPITGKQPMFMVINKAQKGETSHLSKNGTKFLVSNLNEQGIKTKHFYYTSLYKHATAFTNADSISKEYENDCIKLLQQEIELVQPSFILVTDSNVTYHLFGEKSGLKDNSGKMIYVKKYDTFVIYGISPQWAFYDENVQDKFFNVINKIASLIYKYL